MTVTNRPTVQKKNCSISIFLGVVSRQDPPKVKGDGGSAKQKHRASPLSDTVRDRKNSSRIHTLRIWHDHCTADKSKATTNRNLTQGKENDDVPYSHVILWPGVECIFEAHRWVNVMDSETDCVNWWVFSQSSWWWKSKDYSLQSSLGRIRQEGRRDTWESITHLQGHATMVITKNSLVDW
jgi:hypothetical protein